MNSAFWASRSIAVALAVPLAGGAALAADPVNLRIGTVTEAGLSDDPADFVLDLDQGQGVIVDLTPLEEAPEVVSSEAVETGDVEIAVDEAVPADDLDALFDEEAVFEDAPAPVVAYPAMRLLDSSGKCLRAVPEEDGCGRASARLSAIEGYPADGTIRLAFYPVERGRFTLRLNRPGSGASQRFELLARQRQLPSPPVVAPIAICEEDMKVSCGTAARLASDGRAYFSFTVPREVRWVQVDMTSTVLDSLVELRGPVDDDSPIEEAPLVASNDDGGGNLNARLRSELVGGVTYAVVAANAGFGAPQGDFILSVRAVPPPAPPPPPTPLEIGREYSVRFDGSEPLLPGGWPRPYHLYTVEGEPGMTLTVDMASNEIDSMLEAGHSMAVLDVGNSQAGDFALLTSNDDGGGGRNARLLLRFEKKATVTLRASLPGAPGATGAYTIVARRVGEGASQAVAAR